jgi:predicted nucleic-acid-binding protein
MKAVDTNVLIRFLVKDDEQQAETIYRIFKQAESDRRVSETMSQTKKSLRYRQ